MSRSSDNSASDEQNLRIQEIEHGKLASLASGYLAQPIQEAQEKAMRKLINSYRAGKTEHDMLVGIAAELSALDLLMESMRNTVQRAEVAAQKEYTSGERR